MTVDKDAENGLFKSQLSTSLALNSASVIPVFFPQVKSSAATGGGAVAPFWAKDVRLIKVRVKIAISFINSSKNQIRINVLLK